MAEPTFAELVRLVAAEHGELADPRDLVPFLLEEIQGREEEALERLLPSYIGAVLRRRGPASADEKAQWRSFLKERVATDGGVIFAADATAYDLDAGAERRRRFAGNLDGRAARYAAAASAMREAGVETAKELPMEDAVASLRTLAQQVRTMQHSRLLDSQRVKQLTAMRRFRDTLVEMVEAGRSPALDLLIGYRTGLERRAGELIASAERAAKREEYDRGFYGG